MQLSSTENRRSTCGMFYPNICCFSSNRESLEMLEDQNLARLERKTSVMFGPDIFVEKQKDLQKKISGHNKNMLFQLFNPHSLANVPVLLLNFFIVVTLQFIE